MGVEEVGHRGHGRHAGALGQIGRERGAVGVGLLVARGVVLGVGERADGRHLARQADRPWRGETAEALEERGSQVRLQAEIGTRQAVGATPDDIRMQFLSEALLLSIIGGLIGMLVGVYDIGALIALRSAYWRRCAFFALISGR